MATPPPKEDWETGKTAAQADAENVIGRQNREKVGLGGYGGRSSEQLDAINYQTQQRQEQEQNQRLIQEREAQGMVGMKYSGWEQESDKEIPPERTYLENLENRPGYYDPSTIGDTETQRRVAAGENMGDVLESQRKAAELTPGTRDDQYFLNELSKWNRTGIETSSEYHVETKATGLQQKANPYENWGDVALAIEKGGNQKDFTVDKYGFNPNVGGALGYTKPMKYQGWEGDAATEQQQSRQVGGVLPGGKGLQETAWEVAKSNKAANVDFQPAVDYLNYQKGRMGPYGNLYGGVPDTTSNMPPGAGTPGGAPVYDESGAKRPFVSVNAPRGETPPTGKDWNPMVVSAAEPTGYISEGIQIPNTTPPRQNISSEINFASIPLIGMFAVEGKFLGRELKFDAGEIGRYFNAPTSTVTEKGTPVISGGNQTITNLGFKITQDKQIISSQQTEIESLIKGNVTPTGEYKGTEAGYLALTGKIESNKKLVEATNRDVDTYNAMSEENKIVTTTPIVTNTTVGKSKFQLQWDKPITDFIAGIEKSSREGLSKNTAYQEAIKNTPEQKKIVDLGKWEPTQYSTALTQPFFEKSVQYFKEEPVTGFGVKVAEGYIIAEGFGLLGAGFTKAATIAKPLSEVPGAKGAAVRTISTGGTFLMENAGKLFIAGYGAKTVYDATEGGTNLEPKPVLSNVGEQVGTDLPIFLGMGLHGGGSRIAEAPETIRTGYSTIKDTASAKVYEYNQARGGIENIGVGGGKGSLVFTEPVEFAKTYTGEPSAYPRGGDVGLFLDKAPERWFSSGVKQPESPTYATDINRYAYMESQFGGGRTLLETSKQITPRPIWSTERTTITRAQFEPDVVRLTQIELPESRTTSLTFEKGKMGSFGNVEAWTTKPSSSKEVTRKETIVLNPYSGSTMVVGQKTTRLVPESGKVQLERYAGTFNLYNLEPTVSIEGNIPVSVPPINAMVEARFQLGVKEVGARRINKQYGEISTSGQMMEVTLPEGISRPVEVTTKTTEIESVFTDLIAAEEPTSMGMTNYQQPTPKQMGRFVKPQVIVAQGVIKEVKVPKDLSTKTPIKMGGTNMEQVFYQPTISDSLQTRMQSMFGELAEKPQPLKKTQNLINIESQTTLQRTREINERAFMGDMVTEREAAGAIVGYKPIIQELYPLTPKQKLAQNILDIQDVAFQPGSFEKGYLLSADTGEHLTKPILGESESGISGIDKTSVFEHIWKTRPQEENFIYFHTHPKNRLYHGDESVIGSVAEAITLIKNKEISPKNIIKIPKMAKEILEFKQTTPSDLDIVSSRSASRYGVVTQGVITKNKLLTWNTDVTESSQEAPDELSKAFEQNRPSKLPEEDRIAPKKIYTTFGQAMVNAPWNTKRAESEFIRTGTQLGFEPSIYTRSDLKNYVSTPIPPKHQYDQASEAYNQAMWKVWRIPKEDSRQRQDAMSISTPIGLTPQEQIVSAKTAPQERKSIQQFKKQESRSDDQGIFAFRDVGITQIPAIRSDQRIEQVQQQELIKIQDQQLIYPNNPLIETPSPPRRPPIGPVGGLPFILPSFGGPGGYGTKRRGRKFVETFHWGLDISARAGLGVKPKKGRAKKGRLLPAKRAKKK